MGAFVLLAERGFLVVSLCSRYAEMTASTSFSIVSGAAAAEVMGISFGLGVKAAIVPPSRDRVRS